MSRFTIRGVLIGPKTVVGRMAGMLILLGFMPLPWSSPWGTWAALLVLAIWEARERIHGQSSDRSRLAVLVAIMAMMAAD